MVNIENAPWFVAVDVCRALEMPLNNGGVSKYLQRLGADEKRTLFRKDSLELFGGDEKAPSLTTITESGLYKLTLRSNKPEARAFQDWVTKVVLPAIRKDGGYVRGEEFIPWDHRGLYRLRLVKNL